MALVTGTNCGNCKFFGTKTDEWEGLNTQGGIMTFESNKADLKKAEGADLVTLPGTKKPGAAHMCNHKRVDQPVNDRMCCAFWDNDGARREWRK